MLKKPLMQLTAGKWAFEGIGCSIAEVCRLWVLKPLLEDWFAIRAINPSAIQRSIAKAQRIGFIPTGTDRSAE